MTHKARVGRPQKTFAVVCEEAVAVLEIALAIKQRRLTWLKSRGLSETAALKFLFKRRRGLLSGLIADDVQSLTGRRENRTRQAIQLVVEHGMSVRKACALAMVDERNIRRLLPKAKVDHRITLARRARMAVAVWDAALLPDSNYLPESTTARDA